jgi:hypothetical protein
VGDFDVSQVANLLLGGETMCRKPGCLMPTWPEKESTLGDHHSDGLSLVLLLASGLVRACAYRLRNHLRYCVRIAEVECINPSGCMRGAPEATTRLRNKKAPERSGGLLGCGSKAILSGGQVTSFR